MKQFIIILFTLLSFNINAQMFGDTLKIKPVDTLVLEQLSPSEVNANMQIMQLNLIKCHKQWNIGLTATVFGMGSVVIGGIITISDNIDPSHDKSNKTGLIFSGVGGLIMLVGEVIMLDSHKYINKAGLGLSNKGLVYRFK